MARAYGANAALLLIRETTYGQSPGGNFVRMPFTRCDLGSEQGLISDPVLGYGRDPASPCSTSSPTTATSSCPSIPAPWESG